MAVISKDLTEHGAVVDLFVGVSAARQDKLTRAGFKAPDKVRVQVVIDTGSHVTGFDPSVFQSLAIGSVDRMALHTPSTGAVPHVADQFQVTLSLPYGTG